MADAPPRATIIDRARKLLARAAQPTSDEDHEALSAYRRYCALARKHDIKLPELFASGSVTDRVRSAAESARATAESVHRTATDPEVRANFARAGEVFDKGAAAAKNFADLFRAGADFWKAVSK